MSAVAAAGLLFAAAAIAEPTLKRQRELMELLHQDCGSCHGLTLKGGLGPPLTREALIGKSPHVLQDTIVNGRPGTPMASWAPFLSRAEAAWLVDRLMDGNTHAP